MERFLIFVFPQSTWRDVQNVLDNCNSAVENFAGADADHIAVLTYLMERFQVTNIDQLTPAASEYVVVLTALEE